MFTTQLTPQQRCDKAVIAIMGHERYTALAGILMIGERLVVDKIPNFPPNLPETAATNGRDEWYNKDFIAGISDKQLRGVILHESGHKMYRHLTTWQQLYKKDADCANRSCDHVLNIRIHDDNKSDGFAELPEGGCCDFRFRGMNSVEVFNILYKEKGGGGGDGKGDEPNGEGDGGGQPTDHHDWDGAQELSEDEKHELERDIDEAIRQGALAAGKSGSGSNRDIDELMETQVDWREVLRDFVTSNCAGHDYSTWRMPSKRYIAGGLYMPRGVSEQVEELCVEVDMSGSTWSIVPYFMGELAGICKLVRPATVRVIYWDTSVCREEVYKLDDLDNMINVTKPKGSGGTVVSCVPDYCNDHAIKPQCHIVLTDGYLGGDWGRGWNAPVLWCICDNKSAIPSHGKFVHINSNQR